MSTAIQYILKIATYFRKKNKCQTSSNQVKFMMLNIVEIKILSTMFSNTLLFKHKYVSL